MQSLFSTNFFSFNILSLSSFLPCLIFLLLEFAFLSIYWKLSVRQSFHLEILCNFYRFFSFSLKGKISFVKSAATSRQEKKVRKVSFGIFIAWKAKLCNNKSSPSSRLSYGYIEPSQSEEEDDNNSRERKCISLFRLSHKFRFIKKHKIQFVILSPATADL